MLLSCLRDLVSWLSSSPILPVGQTDTAGVRRGFASWIGSWSDIVRFSHLECIIPKVPELADPLTGQGPVAPSSGALLDAQCEAGYQAMMQSNSDVVRRFQSRFLAASQPHLRLTQEHLEEHIRVRRREQWAMLSWVYILARGISVPKMAPFLFDDGTFQALKITYNKPQTDNTTGYLTTQVADPECTRSVPMRAAGTSPDDKDPQLDTVDDLAFGFELKCLLPLLVKSNMDPEPHDKRRAIVTPLEDEKQRQEQAYKCLVDTIRETGQNATTIAAINKLGREERQYWESSWIVKKANSAVPLDEERALEGYVWVPIEVNSPKLRARDPETCRRVSAVLTALNSAHRLRANYSCEVHVHLGRMDGHPFSLSTLKRLATLLWLAEPILRSIRDPKSPNYNSVYTWGSELRGYSRLAKKLQSPVPAANAGNDARIRDEQLEKLLRDSITAASVEDSRALHEIWRTSSHLDLGRLLSGDERRYRRLGFNFSAFGLEDERAKSNPRTLEFRIMEGVVQTGPILGWLFISSAIAEAAVVKSDDRFARAVGRMLREKGLYTDRVQLAKTGEAPGVRLGRAFRELMEDLEVPRAFYHGLEEKIVREN